MCARGGKKLGKRRSALTKSPRNRTTKPMKLQMRYLGEASSCCLYQLYLIPAPADWVSYGIISIIRFWAYYLVGGLDFFLFFHILGIIIPTDFHIFQRGWNHQPAIDLLDSFNMLLHPLRFIFRIVGYEMSQTWIMDDYGLSKSWLADVSRYVWKAQLTDLGTNFLSIVIVFAIKHHVFVNIVFFCIAVIRNGKNFAYFLWCPKTSLIVSYLPIFFPYFSMVIHDNQKNPR